MCSTKRIAITFLINLDKYGKLETGESFSKFRSKWKFFQQWFDNIWFKCCWK